MVASLKALDRASVVQAIERLRVQGVDGILVIVSEEESARRAPCMRRSGRSAGGRFEAGPDRGIPVVAVDQAEGATLATRHLLDLGHTTVHHITGPLSSIESQQRAAGWRATLEAAGAPRPLSR